MSNYEPLASLDVTKEEGRVLSGHLHLLVSFTGNEADLQNCGVVSTENSLNGTFERTTIEDGPAVWKKIPIKENWDFAGKFKMVEASLIALSMGKNVDSTTTPGSKRIGLSAKPKPSPKLLYWMIGELDDGSPVKIVFWKGQMESDSFKLSASDMANGYDFKLIATKDSTKDEEEQLGYIEIRDAA